MMLTEDLYSGLLSPMTFIVHMKLLHESLFSAENMLEDISMQQPS